MLQKNSKHLIDRKCFIFYFKKKKKNIPTMSRAKPKVSEHPNWIMNFIYESFTYTPLTFSVAVKVREWKLD